MATPDSIAVQEKKEAGGKGEKTTPARFYVPNADIYETADGLTVVMEVPGVEKQNLDISLENDVLRIEGRIDFSRYEGYEPLYSEYNVGHYARAFTISSKVDTDRISAELEDGVLTLRLGRSKEAAPRKIAIQ